MKLTSFTDYSLRVLIYLAAEPGRRATIAEIATSFGVSENHLTKVVHFLGKEGLLVTVRGKGGGMGLARAADQINVGDVVRRTEGTDATAECFDPLTNRCTIAPMCRLQGVLRQALTAFYAVLDAHTLSDLVENRDQLAPVLFATRDTLPGARPKRPVEAE